MLSLNECELTIGISILANAIASNIDDNDLLALISCVVSQLGDSLATISAQRTLCNNKNNAQDSTSNTQDLTSAKETSDTSNAAPQDSSTQTTAD